MTKIDALKAAYEAVPKEEWRSRVIESDPYRSRVVTAGCCVLAECNGSTKETISQFITIAHNLMPQLLEAVELVDLIDRCGAGDGVDFTDVLDKALLLQEKLK